MVTAPSRGPGGARPGSAGSALRFPKILQEFFIGV